MSGQKQVGNFCMQIKLISDKEYWKMKRFFFSSDYYNYYYGGYSETPEATDTPEGQNVEMVAATDAASSKEATEVTASDEAAVTEEPVPAENNVATVEVCV